MSERLNETHQGAAEAVNSAERWAKTAPAGAVKTRADNYARAARLRFDKGSYFDAWGRARASLGHSVGRFHGAWRRVDAMSTRQQHGSE
jgi:hypothetical protein